MERAQRAHGSHQPMTEAPRDPLDHAELERSSLGDHDFERELLAEFLGGSRGTLAKLAEALDAHDVPAVRHAAHSLKGGCWTVGARAMGTSCEELELDARAGVLDRAEALLARIREEYAQLDAYVRRHWGL
jgi:HPt (histidine-containing phosphotransfer) domain-containing protein